jgi:uncharacterized damage-inducible protein DinB
MIRQTPWFERQFDFSYSVGLFPVIVERLRGAAPRIEKIVGGRTGEDSGQNKNGWSVKEQIGHLYDLEELWSGRIEDFLAGKQILRPADLNNMKTYAADHNRKTIDELISQFSEARMKLVARVEDIDEATASLIAVHPRLAKPMRLIDSLFFVAEHDDHHIAKIREMLEG